MDITDLYRIDKARVKTSFNRAADTYDAAAVLQKEVRERMFSRLELVKLAPNVIVDAGSGTGQGSQLLRQRYPQSHVVELDLALQMLRKSRDNNTSPWKKFRSRLLGQPENSAICGDIENLPLASESTGLLWSNLAIQWCNDLDLAFSEAHRVLQAEGLLMFSTFGPDTLKELREASAEDAEHVHVSRFLDMHDIGDALVRAGFSAPVLDVEHFVLTYDDVLGVMRDLKAIGAHNATAGRQRGLEGKGFLRGLAERYEQFRQAGKLPATFEVVYGHAWKPMAKNISSDDSVPITLHRRKPEAK
jgi:malonyl-CoA O-methyltransferase